MFYTALIFGLLGSFHCVGMCGPIAFLLPLDRNNNVHKAFQLSSYHVGRIVMYSLLGMLFGMIGKGLDLFGVQQQLSIGIGVLMILLIVVPSKFINRFKISQPIYRLVSSIKGNIGKQLKSKRSGTFFTLGFLNGLLPCGLVYMAVFGAIATGDSLKGSLYMALFGIGTIPLMTATVYLGSFLNQKFKNQILKRIPIMIIIVGCLFILRGMGLGIPYISPSNMVTVEQVSSQQSCH